MILKWTQIRERPCQFISTTVSNTSWVSYRRKRGVVRVDHSVKGLWRTIFNLINHWSCSLRNFGRVYRLDGVMNKCSCYVVAEKLTLSDFAGDFYFIIQIYFVQTREIMRKTTNELYTPTQFAGGTSWKNFIGSLEVCILSRVYTDQLNFSYERNSCIVRKRIQSSSATFFKHKWIFTLCRSAW